jgi:hypothetical protein
MLSSPFACVQSHPSISRVVRSLPPCTQPGQPHNWCTAPNECTSGVPGRGEGSGLEARLEVTVRGVVTTTLMVT